MVRRLPDDTYILANNCQLKNVSHLSLVMTLGKHVANCSQAGFSLEISFQMCVMQQHPDMGMKMPCLHNAIEPGQ